MGVDLDIRIDRANICELADPHTIECLYCNRDPEVTDGCDCHLDIEIEALDYYCHTCNDIHENIDVLTLLGVPEDEKVEVTTTIKADDPNKVPQLSHTVRCRHYNIPMTTLDGTTVYASSAHERKDDEAAPDFGLYLDGMWRASCLAYTIGWPDMGLPVRYDAAAHAIIDVYNKAREGAWVEVGCIGGHGRTGTVLACMAILGGMKPDQAIEYVRRTYCRHAIETKSQEWWIEWFDVYVNTGSLEMYEWDKDLKKNVLVHTFNYSTPFAWEDFEILDNPLGAPPEEIVETIVDIYVTVPWWDKDKLGGPGWRYAYIEKGEEHYDKYYAKFQEQERRNQEAWERNQSDYQRLFGD